MCACQEPFTVASSAEINRALRLLLDTARHPVLIHSLRGQARVGVVVGCLRRLQHWSLAATFDEYRRFAGTNMSLLDLQSIETWDAASLLQPNEQEQSTSETTGELPSPAQQHPQQQSLASVESG